MMIPTIHLNGSSRERLLQGYCDAANAIRAAMDVLQEHSPHGRDYYPQGDGAFAKASDEHRARVLALDAVQAELARIALAISEAG
jgi:hypothetical protein